MLTTSVALGSLVFAALLTVVPPVSQQPRILRPGGTNWAPNSVLGVLTTRDIETGGETPTSLVEAFTGPNVVVSNVQYSGVGIAAGTFTGGIGIIGFDQGIVISSGNIAAVVGPTNSMDGTTTDNNEPGDADLDALVGGYSQDRTVLEFDFECPNEGPVTFQYVFASEEYDEFVNSPFNDVFAFFLNGQNIALIPDTVMPVAINNLNCGNPYDPPNGPNCSLYVPNDCDSLGLRFPCSNIETEMDGLTVVLTATGNVINGPNHIKLAIADRKDRFLDSAVFIRAQSLCAHGEVVLGDQDIPMRNVVVEAVDPGNPNHIVATSTTTSSGGYYLTAIPDGDWIVRASLTYASPTTGLETITNYPEHAPSKTWNFIDGGPSDRISKITYPSPVIMQGGWRGVFGSGVPNPWPIAIDYLTLDPATDVDKSTNLVPAFMCYANHGYDASAATITHDANARQLAGFINAIDLNNWVESSLREQVVFSVLAHSMGGLITRAMVSPSGPNSPIIQRIVNLDSPHGGSQLAGRSLPALHEEVLNGSRPDSCRSIDRPGWNAAHVESPFWGRSWLLYSCVSGGVVNPDNSAWGLGRPYVRGLRLIPWETNPACYLRWVQGWDVTVGDSHSGIHDNTVRLRESALFLSHGNRPPHVPSTATVRLPGLAPLRSSSNSTEGLGFLAGTLSASAGSSSSQVVRFDLNSVVYGRVTRGGTGATYVVLDDSGTPLTLTNVSTEAISDVSSFDSFDIVGPPLGNVDIRLTASSSDAEMSYAFYFSNHRRMSAVLVPDKISEGGTTRISARIVDVSGHVVVGNAGAFVGALHSPNGTVLTFPLFDDGAHSDGGAGDGVFGGIVGGAATGIAGQYAVEVHGTQDFGSYSVERSGRGGLIVMPTGATLTGTIVEDTPDNDQDGLFDSLRFNLNVALTSNGSFAALAELIGTGGVVAVLSSSFDNTDGPGTTSVQLTVLGPDLVRHGVVGPWTLSQLRLIKLDADSLPTDTAPDHVTQPYDLSLFEQPLPPEISSLIPSSGSPAGGNQIVLQGSRLSDASHIFFGTQEASFVVQDDHSLLVTTPPMVGSTSGTNPTRVDVAVVSPWGGDVLIGAFAYQP